MIIFLLLKYLNYNLLNEINPTIVAECNLVLLHIRSTYSKVIAR